MRSIGAPIRTLLLAALVRPGVFRGGARCLSRDPLPGPVSRCWRGCSDGRGSNCRREWSPKPTVAKTLKVTKWAPPTTDPNDWYEGGSTLPLGGVQGHKGYVLSYMIEGARRAAELEIVLDGFEPAPWPVNLVYLEKGLVPLKLRAFLDWATPRLKTRMTGA